MRKRSIKSALQPFAVVTGSSVEALFFEQMKKDCRYRNMQVFSVKAASLEELIGQAQQIKLRNRYSHIWAVASLGQYGKNCEEITAEKELADRKKISLAYADPSILLYFALHFVMPSLGASDSECNSHIVKNISDFKWTEEYLLHEGTEFHLKLFKNKAKAGLNEAEFNKAFELKHSSSALNFISFLNDISLYCGEGDIAYNQKTIN